MKSLARLSRLAFDLASWPFRVADHRRALAALAGLDDRELADIGLMRQDLRDVTALPLGADPTLPLAERAQERAMNYARPARLASRAARRAVPPSGGVILRALSNGHKRPAPSSLMEEVKVGVKTTSFQGGPPLLSLVPKGTGIPSGAKSKGPRRRSIGVFEPGGGSFTNGI